MNSDTLFVSISLTGKDQNCLLRLCFKDLKPVLMLVFLADFSNIVAVTETFNTLVQHLRWLAFSLLMAHYR